MKVTIDRAKWNVGERLGLAALLHERNRSMCCLGFLGASCGIELAKLEDHGMPTELDEGEQEKYPGALFRRTNAAIGDNGRLQWEDVFQQINDDKSIDDATRESWIAEGFRTVLGVEVEFVGEYPEASK